MLTRRARAGVVPELEAKRAEVEMLELAFQLKRLQLQLSEIQARRPGT
jgi:hypothetical protein